MSDRCSDAGEAMERLSASRVATFRSKFSMTNFRKGGDEVIIEIRKTTAVVSVIFLPGGYHELAVEGMKWAARFINQHWTNGTCCLFKTLLRYQKKGSIHA